MRLYMPIIRVGGQKAEDVQIISDSVVQCTVPPGIGNRLAVHIILQFDVLVPGLSGDSVLLGSVGLELSLQKAFSYNGEFCPSCWFLLGFSWGKEVLTTFQHCLGLVWMLVTRERSLK
jgi:hypothetical protein